jgi:hypothetical protein
MTDALQAWVASATGLTTVWENQNAPRPPRPYASLTLVSSPSVGHEVVGQVDEDGDAKISLIVEPTISVKLYYAGLDPRQAILEMFKVRRSLFSPSVRESLKASGWVFVEVLLGPIDAPELIDSEYEHRAVMDVRFRTTDEFIDQLGIVEFAEIDGAVEYAEIDGVVNEVEIKISNIPEISG